MFETATFESAGSITTQSRKWMLFTLALNASVVALLILIPLMHPELLPGHGVIQFLIPPCAPPPQQPQHVQPDNMRPSTVPRFDPFAAPRQISNTIDMRPQPEQIAAVDWNAMDSNSVVGADRVFHNTAAVHVAHEAAKGPVHVASQLLEGSLVFKKAPMYPPIAVAARIEGTVVLQATISKAGTIENLHAQSGPAMLQQAALDAVRSWRYRPYILNGQPVEVETTVNVVFNLSH
jgi:periplasmic protein TonB